MTNPTQPPHSANEPTEVFSRNDATLAPPDDLASPDAPTTQFEGSTAYVNTPAPDPAPAYVNLAPAYVDPAPSESHALEPRRGTIDLGLLLLRLLIGGILIVESLGTFFRLGGSPGLGALREEFAPFAFGNILAIGLPTAQLAAGVFLVLGLLSPLAAMVAIVATGFSALYALAMYGAGVNVFAWPETVWLPLILFGLAIVLQFTGPGLYSFDVGRTWARRPLTSSWVFLALGCVLVAVVWFFTVGINPFG